MKRLAAAVAMALILTGCSKAPQPQPQPPAEPSPQQAEAPAIPAFSAASTEERLVLETLFKLATGQPVSAAGEADGAPDHTPIGFTRLGWLPGAGQAWEGAGLAQGAAGRITTGAAGFTLPLREYARRLQFLDFARAKVIYLDRTAAPERYAALVHVPPMSAFLGLTFTRQDKGYALTALVDTQGYTFRRAPEEDLRILDLIGAERWDELSQELLAPYEYLVAYRRSDGSAELVRDFIQRAGQVQVFEGALIAGKESFAFDWVRLPDGALKIISAHTDQLYDDPARKPVTAKISLRQLEADQIRTTANRFVQLWGSGDLPAAQAMITDLPRFEALSELSRFGHKQWPWNEATWNLAAEKARLDGGFFDGQPLPWAKAAIQHVTTGPLPRAEFRFGDAKTVLTVYVEAPGKVSSIEVSFAGSDEFGNGLHLGVFDLLPRLGDWAQGESLLQHAAAGRWAEAAAAARINATDLRNIFTQQPEATAKVEPGGWPHSERMRLGYAGSYLVGDLSVAMSFRGPDGARTLDRVAFGTRSSPASLPQDPYMPRGGAPNAPTGWADPAPFGNKIALLEPPSEISSGLPIRFYRGAGGQLVPAAELNPPEPEMVWIGWYRWQHPERAEWWVRYGPVTWDSAKQGVARITWEGEKPVIAATYPAPKLEDGEAYFADIDRDGTPEFLGLNGIAHAGAHRPVSLQWLKDGQWQEREFPAGNHWPKPRADQISSRFVWKLPDRVLAVPLRTSSGPDKDPVSYPAIAATRVEETGGLVWWGEQGRLQWLAPDGPVNVAGDTVVAVGPLTTAETTVLVSSSRPAVLRLYSLKGALLWESPFPLALEEGLTVDMNGDGRPDVVAHGRHPDEPKLSRVVALGITPAGPRLVWEGPSLRYQWSVSLAAGDLDGTARPEIFVMMWSGKGYSGYTVYSDSTPAQ